MPRALAVAALCVGAWSCALLPLKKAPPPSPVQVRQLDSHFTSEERAEFHVVLDVENPELRAGSVRGLEWELWISGRWFAAGRETLEAPLPRGHRELAVDLPVAFHRLPITPGTVPLQVGFRGGLLVEIAGSEERLPFQQTATVVSQGAPVFRSSDED